MERECWQETDQALIERLRRVETRSRELYGESLELLAEIENRGLVGSLGYPNLVELLRDVVRVSRAEGRKRQEHLRAVGRAPSLAAAVSEGAIGPEHVTRIAATLDTLPPADADAAEDILVDAARELDPLAVKRLGQEIIARVDQDGPEPTDTEPVHALNELHLTMKHSGRVAFRGELDAESGAVLTALLSPLAKPRPVEGRPDLRGVGERQGDAFADLIHLAANAAVTPIEGGERPHLTVTVSLETLRQAGGATRQTACDAAIIPMVLGSKSQPLDVGRTTRTIPPAIRRALVQRDTGCTFPTCDRRASWTDAHHLVHWADGGPTSLDNLVLLCRMHHRIIHRSQWEVHIRDGIPEFTPPPFLDPDQVPRVNPIWRSTLPAA